MNKLLGFFTFPKVPEVVLEIFKEIHEEYENFQKTIKKYRIIDFKKEFFKQKNSWESQHDGLLPT